ncbi:MAG TPA: hypothetical protein VM262_14790 [Acidimicrobiales bacterium]|nr:hypothetical protein [Acidimicrobiales bacterium]
MSGRRRWVRAAAVAAAAGGLVVLAACGDGEQEVAVPTRVDAALAPEVVHGDLKLYENRDEETVAAFANAGARSLVSDGKVWEIRRADRLVGALQVTTVLPTVDLSEEAVRSTIVRQIIPGAQTRIRIDAVEVYTTEINDKAVFVWFGDGLYQVLQIKDAQLDGAYEEVATDVIRHQATVPAWKPLPDAIVELDPTD